MSAPRKVEGVLDFIEKFETQIKEWPADEKWPITRIAQQTNTPLPYVVEALTEVLDRAIDIHDPISRKDGDKSLAALKQRMRHEIESRRRRAQERRIRAAESYQKMMSKFHSLQGDRNWYAAYRTLTYFHGVQADALSNETIICICNDALRIGIKAEVNFQELAQWLQKGIEKCLGLASCDAIEEALDFIDAYGEYFMTERTAKGRIFILSLLRQLRAVAQDPNSIAKFSQITYDLKVQPQDLAPVHL